MRPAAPLIVALLLLGGAAAARSQSGAGNLPEMRPIAGRDTPAHRAAKGFMRGANLGNDLEVPPGQSWAVNYTVEDLAHIRSEGFDHIRIPVGWHHYAGPAPGFKLSDDIFAKADFLVTNALQRGLNVILNIHHFDEFTSNPSASTDKFYALWS